MQWRKEFLIGSLIGLCVMLLALLAVVVSPQPRAAQAQSDPYVAISVGDNTMNQGDKTWVHVSFHNMPQDPDDDEKFGVYFRYYFDRNSDGTWTNADGCAEDLVGGNKYITTWYRPEWDHGASPFAITTTCQVGSYRIRVSVKDKSSHTEIVSGTHDITVSLGPSVTIEMPPGPHYRGSAINPRIKFNDLVQGDDYTYTAYLMARNPPNFADICEGTGLERNRTFTLNDVSANPIEKTVTITADCPTNEYEIKVNLEDSDERYRGSDAKEFEITTDPNASPSVTVSLSESSPIAPGTEFDVVFKFYDIQPGTAIVSLDTMTNTSTNQPVGRMDCGGSLVGWGVDVSGTFNHNPDLNRITIPADCPAGAYKIVSKIKNNSGNEIISGSVDFIIGYPDLTPTAPSVSNLNAKQNSPFSHQLPVGTGGDGTLDYNATGLPPGLLFTKSTRTIAGSPTGTGTSTVRYTVTDSDGDSAYVEFTITVDPDLTPSAPSVPGYTAKQNTPFSQLLPAGSGGDGTLSYGATGLPEGLSFITTTRTIAGTPTGTGPSTVRYTVTDSDGDSAYVEFIITVNQDLDPTAPSISALSARKGSLFTRQLPEGTGGDAPLSYNATNLPNGLTFITTTRTITGTPTTVESPTVTYTVRDSDGDENSTTFVFTVAEDLMPTLPAISGYSGKVGSPFSQLLPEAAGGDTPLSYTATNLPTGLSFITSTRTIQGTPESQEAPTVTYTVTDSDGDSAYVEFTITVNPNLTPSAPSVSPLTARQNDPFSHQLPPGSGGDGTLSYDATGLPDGLLFTESTRTIAGTPTRHGPFTVRYTVTDSDDDSDYVEFTITVNQDLEPTAPTISAISARKGSLFTRQLPEGTGGDTPLSYNAANLPTGLTFITTTRTITGTPTTEQAPTVTYTVRDADGDSDSTTFVFTIAADLIPTLPSISGYTGKVGSLFSQELPEAASGDTPLSYTATNLPTGLTFITSTRTITGTPESEEAPTVTYTVTDSDGDSDSVEFTITVNPNLTPSAPSVSPLTAKQNDPFSHQLPAGSGGDGTLSYGATGLPDGLLFTESTRTIAGTPTRHGPFTVRYTVTDSDDDSDYVEFTITVNQDLEPTAPSISGISARKGSLFTRQLPEGTGGDAPLSYNATNLPTGLTFITTTRTITGTPTTEQAPTVTYTVRDADGDEASTTFVFTIAADLMPTLPSISGYSARVDSPFSQLLPEATSGDPPLDYTATNLPTGLSFITSTRTIQGTPSAVESPIVTYTVRDEDGDEDSKTFSITVAADLKPSLPTISGYTGRVGSPFSQELPAATGGDSPLEYFAKDLPAGLSFIKSTRKIQGTPTEAESPTVTYTVRDEDGDEDSKTFVLTVEADLKPVLPTISGYTGRVGSPFSQELPAATSGDLPLSYTAINLPTGLTFITTTRTIQGTPTEVESKTVTYTVRDEDGDEDIKTFLFTVAADLTPTLSTISGFTVKVNSPFSQVLPAATGGDLPLSYTATNLPTGLSFITSTRTIQGTPTAVESKTVTYTVTDDDGDEDSTTFVFAVAADLTPTLPTIPGYTARVGSPFSQVLPAATGGDLPLTYTATDLPAGLNFITTTRTILGTPDTVESPTVTYKVRDHDGDEDSKSFTITVEADNQPSEPSISDMHLKVGSLLRAELPAGSNGDPPYTYTISTLPSGLNFDPVTRILSGRPDSTGSRDVTYTVYDADGDTAAVDFTINVNTLPVLPQISDTSGTKGNIFTLQLPEASGGRTPLKYAATGLPAGLQFITETRTITGTLAQVEIADVTYNVTDADQDQDSETFKITVTDLDQRQVDNNNNNGNNNGNNGGTQNPPALTLGDTVGFTLRVGDQFTQQLPAAKGGTSPYRYSVTTLPLGLSFNEGTHTISGSPTSPGTTNVTYTVTDANNSQVSDDFTITVNPAPLTLPDSTGFSATVGQLFTQQLPAASGGSSPYDYSATILPTGLNFELATRTITGTPAVAVTMVITYSVIDGNRNTARDTFIIAVSEAQTIQPEESGGGSTPGDLQLSVGASKEFAATVGVLFTRQLPAASGGTSPYAYGVSVLPAGLTFEHATRTITGTPSSAETKVVTYRVTDGILNSASDTFTITVSAGQTGQPLGPGSGNTQDPLQLSLGATKEFTATVGLQFTRQLPAASGGSSPYAYGVTTLPAGLDFVQGTHTITGTPTTAETRAVTYSVSDGTQASASDTFTITVTAGQTGPPGQPANGGNQGGRAPGGSPGSGNQGGSNQGGGNQGGGNKGGGSSGSKGNSGSGNGSSNQPKYVPPASSHPPPQQQWSPAPVPVAITVPPWLNVRRGPALDYEVIATVPAGTRGNIYGRDPADNWFQVQIDAASNMVWICQNLATVEGSLSGVRFLEQWEIDLIPKPADGPIATTTPAVMNVRAGPGLTYRILTSVTKGTQATIIGIGPNAEWYKVTLDALSKPAWIYAGLTTVEGPLGGVKRYTLAEVDGYTPTDVVTTDTCNANPIAVTIPAVLNVRRGPGTQFEIVTTVVKGTRAEIVGIDPQEEWLLVKLDSLTEPAWIYRNLTTVVGSLAGVRRVGFGQVGQPNGVTNTVRPVAVTYPALVNIRVGPGLTYGVLKAVPQGTRASIMGLSPDENWYLVEIDGLSQLGWIREDLTVLVGNLNSVKRITAAEIAMLPVAIVDTPSLNVRTGPGLGYGLVTTISKGTWVRIIGVNARTDWLQIRLAGVSGQTWVYRNLTNLAGLLPGVTRISSSTASEASGDYPSLQATTILESASTVELFSTQQVDVSSITVELSLPQNGNIDLEVSWNDADTCVESYKIYHRSNTDSNTYFSLENAVIATTATSKSLSFLTLPDRSLISAWCGTSGAGRQVAEVQVDPGVEGTYSSLPSQPEADAVAASPGTEKSN
ncbi:MAG: putative Ig domain-containing protein [Caldilineaceae bacterium]|nr:putative Ig domain-containing protein [Caldilineaceae bacterium]